jgi:uncharacterized protein
MRSLTPELLAEITRRILAISDPEQIIMFGSYARGDSNPNSDLDLLIVEDVEFLRQQSVRLRQALRGLLFPIDIVVATPEQIKRYRNTIGLIYHSALQEGKVLYDRSAAT